MANLADQLKWCSKSKDSLEELSFAIDDAKKTLDETMDMLQHYNFSEFNNLLRPLQEDYHKGSAETQKFIHDHHVDYLEGRIKFIAYMLEKLNQ